VGEEIQKVLAGQAPKDFGAWGSYSMNAVSATLQYFFDGGPNDHPRDPQVMDDMKQGGLVISPDDRTKYHSAVIQRITEQAYWLPMFTLVMQCAFAKNLRGNPFPDGLPCFYLFNWVQPLARDRGVRRTIAGSASAWSAR
jgi:peptide/nickel transport system substrate-binding protein